MSRLDGEGEHLVAAGKQSFLKPVDCGVAPEAVWGAVRVNPPDSRVIGGWLAAPGQLIWEGAKVASLPAAPIVAVAARGEEVLVASADGSLNLCQTTGCVEPAPATREPLASLGWLPDGRIWGAEARGTVLVTGGDVVPSSRSKVALHDRPQVDVMRLETAPWSREGVAGNASARDDSVLPSHVKETAGPGKRAPVEAPSWQQDPSPVVRQQPHGSGQATWWHWLLGAGIIGVGVGLWWQRARR